MKSWIIFIYFVAHAYAYSEFDRVMSNQNEQILTSYKADVMIRKIVDLAKEESLPVMPVESIFFLFHRKTNEQCLLVLTPSQEFYLITINKTYIISGYPYMEADDTLIDIHNQYKFVYYVTDQVDIDLSDVSLFGIESVFQNIQNIQNIHSQK
jgi:hypothetical protein